MEFLKFSINGGGKPSNYKPITASYSFNSNQQWVSWGANNLMPDEILQCNSETNGQMLFFKALLVSGAGFAVNESNTKLQKYIEDYDQNLVLEKAARNYVSLDGFALELFPAANKKEYVIRQTDYSKVRVDKELQKDDKTPVKYWVSRNWNEWNRSKDYAPKFYPAYNLNESNITDTNEKTHILVHYNEAEGQYFYPLASYYKYGYYYLKLEEELGKFHLNNTTNGMVPTAIIYFKENFTPEQRRELLKNLRTNLQGNDNAGNLVAVFPTVSGAEPPQILPFNTTNNADIYQNYKDTAQSKICSAHALNSPSLAGLPGSGSIFNNELSTAYRYFERTVIKNYQKPLIKVFTKLYREMGLLPENETIDIVSLNALEFIYDSALLREIYTINELREKAGDHPIEGCDVTPASVSAKQNNSINISAPGSDNKDESKTTPAGLNPLAGDITTGQPKSLE